MMNVIDALISKKAKVGNIVCIAIDGHGGSGKSSLAQWLSKKLNAEIIHTDDFASWDHPLDWWPFVIKQIFEPIAKGATVLSYPRSQWWKGHHREPVTNQPVTRVMILEGVSSLRREFRRYISLGLFVNTPKEVCLQRGIQRDLESGKPPEEIKQMWITWFEEENEYIKRDDPQAFADFAVDGTKSFEDQLE